jgi:hypothetical protein
MIHFLSSVLSSPFLSFTDDQGEPLAIWVASTIEQIPPGSFIINPQTGKPYTNPDGSLYKWYPPQSACQDMIAADDAKFAVGSSQYSLMAHQGQVFPNMLCNICNCLFVLLCTCACCICSFVREVVLHYSVNMMNCHNMF